MAPQGAPTSVATLRAITFRMSSVHTSQLPQQIPAISASLPRCKDLISSSQNINSKDASESAVIVHKYKTRLSTLLQDRTIQGRWTAVVLIKATIEIGGWEVLQKSGPWVRGLISILTKPDPLTTKKLSIITLTRLFMLTRDYPTLIREITTPSLSTFIQSCLNLVISNASAPLLHTVLESFNQLLPWHHTIFRSFMTQMQQILIQVLAPTPCTTAKPGSNLTPNFYVSSEMSQIAQQLYVQLHHCAPKAASAEEWEKSFKRTVSNVHYVADRVFRAIVEDWQSVSGITQTSNAQTLDVNMEYTGPDPMGLPGWSGVYAGSERMIGLLRLLREFVATPTATAISFRLGSLMDLLSRIFSITVPSSKATDWQNTVRFNNQISREEREHLWTVLPNIHAAALEIVLALFERFGDTLNSLFAGLLEQITWVFNAEKDIVGVRTAVYLAVSALLSLSGPTLPKYSIDPLGNIIRFCCNDILPQDPTTSQSKMPLTATKGNGNSANQSTTNADTFLGPSNTPKAPAADFAGLHTAAHVLLPILLAKLPTQHISDSLRTRMDRTAVLALHKEAMVASVLNPPPTKKSGKPVASIMSLLARSYPHSMDVEGLIRPRMPVIRTGNATSALDDEDDQQDEETDPDSAGDASEESVKVDVENKDATMEEATPSRPAVDDAGFVAYRSPVIAPAQSTLNRLPTISPDPAQDGVTAEKSGKRPQSDNIPVPPSPKRAKIESTSQSKAPSQAMGILSITPKPSDEPKTAPQSTAPTVAGPASLSAPRAAPHAIDADSDDNDFGTLVIGQDTDDEED